MKKISILSIFCLGLVFVSCKKERVCECTTTTITTNNTTTSSTTEKDVTTIEKIKGSEAKRLCVNKEENFTATGYMETTTTDCTLD
jgi:hypothetical protein